MLKYNINQRCMGILFMIVTKVSHRAARKITAQFLQNVLADRLRDKGYEWR
jgi:hypothetical protein